MGTPSRQRHAGLCSRRLRGGAFEQGFQGAGLRGAGAASFSLSLDKRVEPAHVLGVAPVGGAGPGFGPAHTVAVAADHFADAPCDDCALGGADKGGHGERGAGVQLAQRRAASVAVR